jgi:ketosteroid isomerase-like protein
MEATMTHARDFAERLFAVMDGQRWNEFETVMHPDVEMTSPFADLHSAAEWAEFTRGFATAAPDCKHTITQVTQEGERFAVQGIWSGTHTGPLVTPMGEVPATGLPITLPFCTVGTIRDGRLASAHVYLDQLAMLSQLGLVPQPA